MTPEEEVSRAERARQIMDDPMVVDALTQIKSQLLDAWLKSPVKDTELREQIWGIYVGAVKFEEAFLSIMDTGKLALAELKQRG